MTDWRQSLCGSIALQPALKGDGQPDLQALKQVSERMSCGGMYIPDWQRHLRPAKEPIDEISSLKTLHLPKQIKDAASVIVINQQTKRATPSASLQPMPAIMESASPNTSAMLREIDNLWHKN